MLPEDDILNYSPKSPRITHLRFMDDEVEKPDLIESENDYKITMYGADGMPAGNDESSPVVENSTNFPSVSSDPLLDHDDDTSLFKITSTE